MIGAPIKIKLNMENTAKSTKEIQSFTLSGPVVILLHNHAHEKGVSKSEIVEYASGSNLEFCALLILA